LVEYSPSWLKFDPWLVFSAPIWVKFGQFGKISTKIGGGNLTARVWPFFGQKHITV
jgi:hypothetical protein